MATLKDASLEKDEKDIKDNAEQEAVPDERSEVQNGNSKDVNDKENPEVFPDKKTEIHDLKGTEMEDKGAATEERKEIQDEEGKGTKDQEHVLDNRTTQKQTMTDMEDELFEAVKNRQEEIVRSLIKQGVNVNKRYGYNATALMIAALNGSINIVDIFLSNDVDVDAEHDGGWTALMVAAQRGHTKIVGALIEKEADVKKVSPNGVTALYLAAEDGNVDTVNMLIESGAEVPEDTENAWIHLIIAACQGHDETVKILLNQNDCFTTQKISDGRVILHIAATSGHIQVVDTLIKVGAEVNVKDRAGGTPLMTAAKKGHIDIVDALIEAGAEVNAKNEDGETPLMFAAENGHIDIVNKLIKAGAEVNAKDKYEQTPLMFAAGFGHIGIVNKLIKAGAEVNAENVEGYSPLLIALRLGHIDIVDALIQAGAEVNAKDEHGQTPLMIAVENSPIDIVDALIQAGAEVNVKDRAGLRQTPLMTAAEKGHIDIVDALIQAGAEVNAKDEHGQTPLMTAVENGPIDIVDALIQAGAEVNVKDRAGLRQIPLMTAAKKGHIGIVDALIQAGAEVNVKAEYGQKPLLIAAGVGHIDIVNKLIEAGAEVNAQHERGYSPLMLAVWVGNIEIVNELIEAGAEVNAKNRYGETPLMIAAWEGHIDIVNELIEAGAGVNAQDRKNKTALMFAAEEGKAEMVDVFLEASADVNAETKEGETALTLLREELILKELSPKISDEVYQKTRIMTEEDIIKAKHDFQKSDTKKEPPDLLSVIERSCGESFTKEQKEEIAEMLKTQLPKYKEVREKSLVAGGYDSIELQRLETEDLISVIERACDENFTKQQKEEIAEMLKTKLPKYKAIREKLLLAGGYDVRKLQNPRTKEKLKRILYTTEEDVLKKIVKNVTEKERKDAVIPMLEFMIADSDFVKKWNFMFHLLPNKEDFYQENFLNRFAVAGNVEVVSTMLTQAMITNRYVDQEKKEETTFLHTLAEKHDVKTLKSLFQGINRKEIEDGKKKEREVSKEKDKKNIKYLQDHGLRENRRKETSSTNWVTKCIDMQDELGYTFLAVAVNKTETETETDMITVLKWMIEIFTEDFISRLCKKTDKGGNNLAHLAVRKSLTELTGFIISKTADADKIFNREGYNPLHLAVKENKAEVIARILDQEHFNINTAMSNGETALYIAAQLGHSDVLQKLIEQEGDLSVTDKDEGHTPLHDCLQQVYFEGVSSEENYEKFQKIWNTVVEKAVTWWCKKQGQDVAEPANGSEEYLRMQCKAVYYLRSCIKNKNGLSVLQFAADRGLVTCVQTMLSTKGVFVIQTEKEITNQETEEREIETVHEIDVTNLCPEFFVKKDVLFTEHEQHTFKPIHKQKKKNQKDGTDEGKTEEAEEVKQENKGSRSGKGDTDKDKITDDDDEMISFLEALSEVKPPNKAGQILESITMMSLSNLEWRVSQRIHIFWMIVHTVLMILATIDCTASVPDSFVRSVGSITLGVIILLYATIITTSHFSVKIMRWRRQKSERAKKVKFVKDSIKEYEKEQDDEGITSLPKKLFDEIVLILELLFTGFAWVVFVTKTMNLYLSDRVWINGFFLLLRWLMLLVPVTSYNRIYKLISVLKYIIMYDMLPWIIIYMIISIGFATAIKLQFDQLPNSTSCIGDQNELRGFLQETGHTLFELVIMTSGLDTDIKHVRSLTCLFDNFSKSAFVILLLITTYAVISAVVLLNMLIAIMSNTVTEAQQDKDWRQYQINQTLWIRQAVNAASTIYSWTRNRWQSRSKTSRPTCCFCCKSEGDTDPPVQSSSCDSHNESIKNCSLCASSCCYRSRNIGEQPKRISVQAVMERGYQELLQSPEDDQNAPDDVTEQTESHFSVTSDRDNIEDSNENKSDGTKETSKENISDNGGNDAMKEVTADSTDTFFNRWLRRNPRAIFKGGMWSVQLDPVVVQEIQIPKDNVHEQETENPERDIFLDRWIRGERQDTSNKHNIRYDKESHRWYLKLSPLDVKEIRAKVWQRQDKE